MNFKKKYCFWQFLVENFCEILYQSQCMNAWAKAIAGMAWQTLENDVTIRRDSALTPAIPLKVFLVSLAKLY